VGQVLAVISGKGGTGKTSLCAGVASCLAAEGRRVLCVDADVGLRNLDIALGMADRAVIPFSSVMDGTYSLDAAAEHPGIPGLFLLTAPVTEEAASLDAAAFGRMLERAREAFDWCLIDAPAGVGAGFRLASAFADRFAVVCTADPASRRDAARAADLAAPGGGRGMGVIVNRVSGRMFRRMAATVDDVMDGVGLPLLGVVPEDPNVTLAAARGTALVLFTGRGAAEACLRVARRLDGRRVPIGRL